jgi:UDP-glucuronate 4-epimerase
MSRSSGMPQKTFLVTGAAGFIGSHTVEALLRRGDRVVGLDNLNDYYDPERKRANVEEVRTASPDPAAYVFLQGDIRDRKLLERLFETHSFEAVIHLAAMAGVRISVEDPWLYYDVNLTGTLNLLDRVVHHGRPNFVFASTSSAYGGTEKVPFVETDPADRPLAPYPASKRAAELLGYSYHHLHKVDFTALRFFTVYGPRGRPDMMAYKVLDSIFLGKEVPLYNGGQMHRDWTFVTDIVAGVIGAADRRLGYEVINLGRGEPVLLKDFVGWIEELAGAKARLVETPMMDADVKYTYADILKAQRLIDYAPKVSVRDGVERFWNWYRSAVKPK